ncbi:V-type ATP synthase subunit D [Methylomonas rapida]|uniref:V-type ATP synthase subunit D n=1 Tax=Methylomonas rapida TaxID=2963939 RepID=A0ABY7GD30_9GAMM|nr:V-type ATP synthase subunit D [Methylomonas rapida]WAR43197.1 V-type ATP synthase subunit D [Methylomonas rapida]
MAKLKLSKHAMHEQQEQLKLYKRLLPSLDLKRRQLTLEAQKAEEEYAEALALSEALETRIGQELPMLADEGLRLRDLVVVKGYRLGEQNVVGVRLPVLQALDCQVADYSPLATPPWLDILVQRLKDAKTSRLRAEIAAQRLEILRVQLRRVTQRVNLFEKILIPTAHTHIQRIRIYLGETERAAVVASKLAKSKQLHERSALTEQAE